MIKTFKSKGLQELHETGRSKRVAPDLTKKSRTILATIDAASTILEINQPGYRLHDLKPSRPATWTVRVNGNWRITFEFRDGDAYDVDLEDYH